MTAATMAPPMQTPKAFAVWFKDLERWDVSSFYRIRWHWPPEVMVPLGDLLTPRKDKVDRKQFDFADLQPITIHFDGSIDKRTIKGNREYSMGLFFALPGDVIVAKIDLKNGAVAIVPDGWDNVVVTSHFAVYRLDHSRIEPGYLHRVIQSGFFKRHLWRNKVGAEGRKEVKLDFFEAQPIPLPPLSVQRAIVSAWEQAQAEVTDTRRRIAELEDNIEADFLADLGLTKPQRAKLPKVFAVWWKDVERWGVQPNQLAATAIDVHGGKYPVATGQDFLQDITHGCSASPSPKPTPLEVLKISAVTRGAMNLGERKFMHDRAEYRRQFDMRAGDVLLCRTNGTLGLVGMSALVEQDIEHIIFPDKVIRLRPRGNILPAYLWKALHMPFARSQIEAAARTAVGNYAIGTDDLWKLEIPLPPLPVQRQLVAKVAAQRKKIAAMKAEAKQKTEQAKAEVEAMILGEQKVRA